MTVVDLEVAADRNLLPPSGGNGRDKELEAATTAVGVEEGLADGQLDHILAACLKGGHDDAGQA